MITFIPKRGAILVCNFDPGSLPPEMVKARPVVVLSIDEHNYRHGKRPGLCTVVPFSSTPPDSDKPSDVFIPAETYRSLRQDSWARTAMMATVSHSRLDLVLSGGLRLRSEFLSENDLLRIETAAKGVLGFA